MKHFSFVVGICLGFILTNTGFAAETPPDFKDSVVKIFVSSSAPDFNAPWQAKDTRRGVGSGAVISGNRILTSAHVVDHTTFIEVKKSDSDTRYRAEIEAIGHDADLALLKVEDETFFEGVPSLEIGPLPELQDTVLVIGFPQGGDELSVTRGVVSRIDAIPYSHSLQMFMAAQIDAAVNAGNSGGPVIQDGKLVGIAFQTLGEAENIAYMVPEPIIRHFLEDLEDGTYDGFPFVGVWWNLSANPSLREHYGIKDSEGGVILRHVTPEIEALNSLRVGDVILSIEGVPVGSDGTVPFRKNSRMPAVYLFDQKQVGESIEFEVLREGKKITVKAPALPNDVLVKYKSFYEKPPYYIYGGMVFTVLNHDLIIELARQAGADIRISNLLYYMIGPGRFVVKGKKDVVVLLYVLPDEVNTGYHALELEVVKEVNGKSISTLEDLALALENNQSEWTVIRTEDKDELVFDRKKAEAARARILANYKIPSPYSDDIKKKLDE